MNTKIRLKVDFYSKDHGFMHAKISVPSELEIWAEPDRRQYVLERLAGLLEMKGWRVEPWQKIARDKGRDSDEPIQIITCKYDR